MLKKAIKIKDNINLKILENYNFELTEDGYEYVRPELFGENKNMCISSTRVLVKKDKETELPIGLIFMAGETIFSHKEPNLYLDLNYKEIQDLVKDNLVEEIKVKEIKIEDKKEGEE